MSSTLPWWQTTTIYQIYPRSYKDSNGDGIGDLQGIISKLDYIRELGFETIWLSPFFQSPQQDWGYDVSDYLAVAPEFGNSSDVEQLIQQTAELDPVGTNIRMEQEPGASGVAAIDHYRRRVLVGRDFDGLRSTGNKEVRANPVSAAASAGNVKLKRAPWNGDLLDEFEAFPAGGHDDQVDAVSGAFGFLYQWRGGGLSGARKASLWNLGAGETRRSVGSKHGSRGHQGESVWRQQADWRGLGL